MLQGGTASRRNKMPRTFLHKTTHSVLTMVMLFLAYTFADAIPTFPTSASFQEMATLMPEQDWAGACAFVGAIGLVTTFTDNWTLRLIAATILATAHLIIAIMIFMGNQHAISAGLFVGYGTLGLALAYSTAHLGRRVPENLDTTDLP